MAATPKVSAKSDAGQPVLLRLLRLIGPFRWWIVAGVILTFATIGASVGLMAVSAYLISMSALATNAADLGVLITGVRFFAISRAALRYAERYVTHVATFRILTYLRVWFYAGIEPLAPARLQQERSGDLLARIMADVSTLENFYVRVVVPPLAAAVVVVGASLFLALFDVWLGVVLFVALVVTGVVLPWASIRLSRAPAQELLVQRGALNAALVDNVQGMADLVVFGQIEARQHAIEQIGAAINQAQERLAVIRGAGNGLGVLMAGLAMLAALGIGIPLVSGGQVDGVLLATLALTAMASFEAVQPLAQAWQLLAASEAAAKRLFDLIDAEPAVGDPPQPQLMPASFGLQVRNLHYRYAPTEPEVLKGVSFDLPMGGKLAVVGASGAGKSTLANLLVRFWDYDQGSIQLGGHELRSYAADDVRAQIAVAEQETHLFNTSIRDNLALANPDVTDAQIEWACQLAQIHDFIAGLPEGYDTRIGENGMRLSGGERQRLAIARALLKDAPILVLDEATSHLDIATEERLLQALQPYLDGRSLLMISHRPVNPDLIDQVVEL